MVQEQLKKEHEPAVAILAPVKAEGSFSLLLWYDPGDEGATQKGQILQLAPAQNGKSKGGGVGVGSQPSDKWHSFGTPRLAWEPLCKE